MDALACFLPVKKLLLGQNKNKSFGRVSNFIGNIIISNWILKFPPGKLEHLHKIVRTFTLLKIKLRKHPKFSFWPFWINKLRNILTLIFYHDQ